MRGVHSNSLNFYSSGGSFGFSTSNSFSMYLTLFISFKFIKKVDLVTESTALKYHSLSLILYKVPDFNENSYGPGSSSSLGFDYVSFYLQSAGDVFFSLLGALSDSFITLISYVKTSIIMIEN